MAKCDEGYLCSVCGEDVASITESDLYLRYVIGLIDPELLHATPERHVRCNPLLAQFIVDDSFEPMSVEGEFGKEQLDSDYVATRESLVTRGWRRLGEIKSLGEVSVLDIPLAEVRQEMQARNASE